MKVEIIRVRKFVPPGFIFPKRLWEAIGKIGAGNIIANVQDSKQADGTSIRENSREWKDFKREKGWLGQGGATQSLVAEKQRFTNGANWSRQVLNKNQGVRIEPRAGFFRRLVRFVQEKGYTGWFGISKQGLAAVKREAQKWLASELRKARQKNRRGG